MPSVNSRLQVLGGGRTHIWGGGVNLMHFLMCFCILGVFLGGEIGILTGGIPQKIAGNNTAVCHCMVITVLLRPSMPQQLTNGHLKTVCN